MPGRPTSKAAREAARSHDAARAEWALRQRLPEVERAQMPWVLEGIVEREDEPHSFEELSADLDVRLDALRRGRTGWGCAGSHTGSGAPNCPAWRHHHHDAFCREPSDAELRMAGVEKPETGWHSRA